MNIHEGKVNHYARYSGLFDNPRSKLFFCNPSFFYHQTTEDDGINDKG